ncbi:MAG: hypothetical protein ACJ77K_03295 [Bacteroidia bacterium]
MTQDNEPKDLNKGNDQSSNNNKIEKGQANINESQKGYSERFGDQTVNKQNAKPYINDDLVKKPTDNKSSSDQ